MAVGSIAGIVVTVIDAAVDGVSAWNVIVILIFVVVFYVGLGIVQRSPA